ncbi:RNA methyltransferase [Xylophilus sp. GOD-11R]|uniref:TrmH family RNA methyltransferase n=1 Tax=Xylophilus sp. GOD-11R TaxID=3089814 RepID=UPI00298CB065|nr:RNA methyltransferase [Xylophilus sp. GOD-11R]WPB58690.1 RNA methyltransferase [Xylophilus sp. GOD-11R]
MSTEPLQIASRDNPLVRELRKLAQDNAAYRKLGQVWIEGDHLCRAALGRSWRPSTAVFGETAWPRWRGEFAGIAGRDVIVADKLLGEISSLESPASMGFLVDLPGAPAVIAGGAAVVLDRVQDAGNVGSIIRSAAAFGFEQVLAIKGTAALWSPKVLRAGMGAHFGLRLVEGLAVEDIAGLGLEMLATSSHGGELLHRAALPWPCAWLLGHEGQGVCAELEALAQRRIRIAQPGGEESLNVAAAAAICLHASGASR